MPVRRTTVRRLYRKALACVFGCGDADLDSDLLSALKKDVHLAGTSPGQWVSSDGVLEIYCESGIPNASDINEFPPMPEFGFEGGCSYNSDKWHKVDVLVNSGLEALGVTDRVFHEPHNGAVVAVHWA